MKTTILTLAIALGSITLAGCVATVHTAPRGEAHPAYLHALTDLRQARAHLEWPAGASRATAWDENVAIREIDAALGEIREAAIDDGKPVGYREPVDARMDWPGRLHRTIELLQAAKRDCEQEEDNGWARGLRGRALQHINAAEAWVEKGMQDNHW